MNTNTNDADDSPFVSDIKAARLMPGMYIGGTNQRALHSLVWVLIGHAIHECVNRPSNQIMVTIEPGNIVSVADDGSGLPTEIDQSTGRPLIEHDLTTYHRVGTNWSGHRQQEGRHHHAYYIGLVVPLALAEKFTVEIKQHGALWRTTYAKGEIQTALERMGELVDPTETGTTITLQPDYSVFQPVDIDHEYMYRSLRDLAFLMSQLTVTFEDKRSGVSHPTTTFYFTDGTADFVQHLNRAYKTLHEPLVIRISGLVELESGSSAELEIDIAVQYTDTDQSMILSYINDHETEEGGVHVQGFLDGYYIGLSVADRASKPESQRPYVTDQEALGGMTAIVSIWYQHPEFEDSAARKLVGKKVQTLIAELVSDRIIESAPELDGMIDSVIAKWLKNRTERLNRRYGD